MILIVVLFSFGADSNRANSLKSGMRELGNVTQHSYDTVVAKLGKPNAISSMPRGQTLAQWASRGYHVAMSFDQDGKCLGIDSEIAV